MIILELPPRPSKGGRIHSTLDNRQLHHPRLPWTDSLKVEGLRYAGAMPLRLMNHCQFYAYTDDNTDAAIDAASCMAAPYVPCVMAACR